MQDVLRHIFHLRRDYARLPFFDHLRDDTLAARERLAFFPCMAPFILAFGDLNRHVMRSEPPSDIYQRMVNAHSYEDDHHWPWYLEDYVKLGHDQPHRPPTEVMGFLWGQETVQSRVLAYRLAHLVWDAQPVVRLAVIEAIEETGNVLFELTTRLAQTVEAEVGVALRYCGEFHFQRESGHAMNNDHAALARIDLDAQQRDDAMQRASEVFAAFTDWTHELLRYAQARRPAPRTMSTA